jgi:multidrug efflux pump subunit AcrA (membrane-fusion protein)
VERAKIDLEDADRNLERQRDLYEKDFIAKKDVEDAEQEYRLSQIQLELSEKQLWVVLGGGAEPAESLDLGTKAFENITVNAPISGVVISLDVEEGEMITSGTQAYGGGGTVLMTIADLSKMIVKTNVNEVDVGKIAMGQSAVIGFDAIRGRVYRGVVTKIAPAGTVEGNVVVFPIEVEIIGSVSGSRQGAGSGSSGGASGGGPLSALPADEQEAIRGKIRELMAQGAGREEIRSLIDKAVAEHGGTPAPQSGSGQASSLPPGGEIDRSGIALIKPGMTADLDIIIAAAENVLSVPKQTLVEQNGRTVVMLLKDGKTVATPVVTGLQDNVNVEIREGLQEGDEVVITGSSTTVSQQSQSRQSGPPGRPPM